MTLRNVQSVTSCNLVSPSDETGEPRTEMRVAKPLDHYTASNSEDDNFGRQTVRSEILTWIRQTRMAAETRQFEAEFARLKKIIEEREPWPYSRFTDALEAGLNCMPRGATYEAMHAIAKRKVGMAKDILSKLEEFPDKSMCIAWERECRSSPANRERDFGRGFHFDHVGDGFADTRAHFELSHGDNDCHDVCVSWHTTGKNWKADALKAVAKTYCSLPERE